MGPLRAVVLAALAALCLAAPTATSPAAAASLEKTVGVREDGSTPDDPTVAADDALDHDNKVERVDLPDFAHSDPCNPNLDLDAHSVSHHGSGLAEANAWTPPPPSIVCPPPSPPPPPLNTLVVDIVAQSVDPGTCAMPASLESFMLDGKWTPGMDEAGSACFFDATWHERDGHTCKVERNVSACAPSVPNSVSGFEETGTGAAGKFGIEAGVRDTCVYAGKFVRCWGSNEADKLGLGYIRAFIGGSDYSRFTLGNAHVKEVDTTFSDARIGAVFSCYLHAKPGAPAGTVSAGEMVCRGGDVYSEGRFVYNRMRKTRYGARFKTDDLSEYTAFSFANNESAIQIDLSNVHACMVSSAGGVACIGSNAEGRLGSAKSGDVYGGWEFHRERAPLYSNTGVLEVAAGGYHTCVRTFQMTVVCWGRNDHGQLGVGDNDNRHELKQQKDLRPVALGGAALQIVAGENFNCATVAPVGASVGAVVEIRCWGINSDGQLGLGDKNSRGLYPGDLGAKKWPVTPYRKDRGKDLASARTMSAGSKHICVLTEDNELKCWGSNDFGQLGLGDRVSRGGRVDELYESKTTQVGTGYKAYAVSAGESHTCVLTYEGEEPNADAILHNGPCVRCFGDNWHFELGYDDQYTRNGDASPGTTGNECLLTAKSTLGDLERNATPGVTYSYWYKGGASELRAEADTKEIFATLRQAPSMSSPLLAVGAAVACVALLLNAAAKRYLRQARLLDRSAASLFGASDAL